ncbi:putative tail-collar fiber protein [Ralstonia phage phiRSP]|uniref:Putative tail-collar fiber protein n=1 Tax=Ralstonia phage phiRSP TaxID=2201420 RepID=A0A345ANT6_9CAUD|nr:tail protein [Ralstonia phage phiRSP]AXF38225.1 putative tail-collar fiber protein [Ralstonia phage phiRSP]
MGRGPEYPGDQLIIDMSYRTIHTSYGLQRMAQAEASGVPINLVAVAVGDGNGNPTNPGQNQAQLVRERYRAAPNRVYQDPSNQQMFIVEMVVPATVGGFTIREIAAFDDQGGMFVLANVPDSYKPAGDGSDGSFGDTVIRMQFVVLNADVVTLQIDPNVAVATQSWIANTITLPYLLKGGATGQMLVKKSNADGDVEWIDPTAAAVVVNTVEETQTLAAAQTTVTLAVCSTIGLAVYIEGIRLRPDQWTPHPTDITELTLGGSYPDGTQADFVQNEPAAFVPTPLIQSKNLSDVADTSAARANIGVDSKVNTDTFAPAGHIAFTARSTAPAGWMKANGAAVSRTAYAALFAAIGTTYGAGDGFNTFNLPDLRGEFIRGFDDGRGIDKERALGAWQSGSPLVHDDVGGQAGFDQVTFGDGSNVPWDNISDPWVGTFPLAMYTSPTTQKALASGKGWISMSRPRNIAMLACIKY